MSRLNFWTCLSKKSADLIKNFLIAPRTVTSKID